MKNRADKEILAKVPTPLLHLLTTQILVPPSLYSAETFYEALRRVRSTSHDKLTKLGAMQNWVTVKLIADDATRPYLSKLISDELTGFHWLSRTSRAVHEAMEKISQSPRRGPRRQFNGSRDAAVNALRTLRKELKVLKCRIGLHELTSGDDFKGFREQLRLLQMRSLSDTHAAIHTSRERAKESGASELQVVVAAYQGLREHSDNATPDFDDLLKAAERHVSQLTAPPTERHQARAVYLRAMFREHSGTAVHATRIAFLTHAAKAVFDAPMEKRDVRGLVKDLATEEKERDAELAAFDAGPMMF